MKFTFTTFMILLALSALMVFSLWLIKYKKPQPQTLYVKQYIIDTCLLKQSYGVGYITGYAKGMEEAIRGFRGHDVRPFEEIYRIDSLAYSKGLYELNK